MPRYGVAAYLAVGVEVDAESEAEAKDNFGKYLQERFGPLDLDYYVQTTRVVNLDVHEEALHSNSSTPE
jgi:hypothetical protein